MTLPIQLLAATFLLLGTTAHGTELRGHGGVVRAIALVASGGWAITAGFDSRIIIWSLKTGEARDVRLFHKSQVNALVALPNGRFASAGADGRIAIWQVGQSLPIRILEGHTGPVAALAISPDGLMLASASWDKSVRLWPLSDGEPRLFKGHSDNVNAVAFLADGTLVSAGYDARIIFWSRAAQVAAARVILPGPLSTMTRASGDRLFVGGMDGKVRLLDRSRVIRGESQAVGSPVLTLAASPDGKYLAVGGSDAIHLLDAANLAPVRIVEASGDPVWSLAFTPDSKALLSAGADYVVRDWSVETGDHVGAAVTGSSDPMAEFAGIPDAEVFRACVACHTLHPNDGQRAGPTLHGLFGRRIASVPGYRYSPSLRDMDIVWTEETVSKLFELGPNTYTPGTKMPEQTIKSADRRAALIRFLKRATATE
ncbi:hypothetical protein EET67_20845 [Pseudaminobacter arsenicus]|uniref:Cytochrome c domain-containing protein n=1 Tax=Borborobacter arsenicus TaxID=1851146 RepID=A0A432V168_9HYPH|nr:hypothetical protein [Pseudaminobacter arsenicus]RUM95845.1 hypothetical protein EET67_20845 [Pseudaminobacter arsenicus]